ncbi:uncharacterized protein STEHIDRAFT_139311 [Stereum hirsutum FP-91666 SS1]|uniref:uncharacterized protein n=1 Tax=Stereum hirsutum (strain FP-91666) TaxID=721885 RepID=UPI000440C8C3|nr:uncharacterized protein STEHIDRAFT_139311 [Stereum hirsutum FP-91666 SS1]EIM86392.1 hypothetical protein STEHIDRAFT_139311 [Stereum hirsutum FP-91666 SS1]
MYAPKLGAKRACDPCRRRKGESGSNPAGQKCSRCIAQELTCTYSTPLQRGKDESREIRLLRKRCNELENRISQIMEGPNARPFDNLSTFTASATLPSVPQPNALNMHSTVHSTRSDLFAPLVDKDDLESSDEEYGSIRLLTEHVDALSLATDGGRSTFHGKSSLTGVIVQIAQTVASSSSRVADNSNLSHSNTIPQHHSVPWVTAREEFSLRSSSGDLELELPEPSLLHELAEIYFARANPWTGLLHHPTFFRSVEKGLHHEDQGFGSVVLLVCALGALHSDDPRHLDDYAASGNHAVSGSVWRSAGWKWACQIDPMRNALSHTPSLYDLQMYALTLITFSAYPTAIDLCGLAGIGVRRAQAVGAHRRKAYGGKLTVEGELWKRAFWALVSTERTLCVSFGRPCSNQDCDLDLPMECDDEFWDHPDPDRRFIQPVGKPSFMSFRICLLKISEILAFASRTLYSTRRSRVLSGLVGPDWEQRVVTELDSSLNRWQDLLPAHLRWQPSSTNDIFYIQAACLACAFYHTQMFIHRRFISVISGHTSSPLIEASTVICLNAARSCGNVILALPRSRAFLFSPLFITAFAEAIVILIMNVSRRYHSEEKLSEQDVRDLDIASKCIAVAEYHEQRSFVAGKARSVLCHIGYLCGLSSVWSMATPPATTAPEAVPDNTARSAPNFSQQDFSLPDDFTRWMGYEALQTEFNPFGAFNEPGDSSLFGFPFDLNSGDSFIEDGNAAGMPPADFPSTSTSDFQWG